MACLGVALILLKPRLPYFTTVPIENKVNHVLEMGRLAPLPPSTTKVQYRNVADEFEVLFEVDPKDVEAFLTSSPGLIGMTPAPFVGEKREEGRIILMPGYPSSIRPEGGQRFEIPPDDKGRHGSVVVAEDRRSIYVYVARR